MDTYHLLLVALAITRHCEALIFTSKPNATTTVCSGENVTFNWIYTSGAPTGIAWTKRNNDAIKSLNASVATFSIGSFIPDAAFATRVAQVGTNAAIQLSGVTPADDGIYQVEITDPPSIFKEDTTLTVFGSPVGNLRASYLGKTSPVKCEGLSSLGSGSLTLVLDGNTIQSTQLLSLEDTSGRGGRYCCCVIMSVDAAKCLPAGDNSTDCSAHCVDLADHVPCDECEVALIAVVILVVLLVMEIATYVIFVGYRWGDKIGTKYMQICEQIITNVRREHILYWICFILGIISIICSVTFFIVICVVCTECLEEGLPIAALVISIIVVITGTINLVMCFCCCCCHKKPAKPDDPCPWLCCCCCCCCCCCPCCCLPNIIHPRRNRKQPVHPGSTTARPLPNPTSDPASDSAPSPSPLPPIPPSMASPRKPVPPSSTTPRALPSPTSDPTSDSAVNPTVHLEPLSVDEPKKKRKKRKKRKTTTEAGGESSDQPMNPTGDSDE